MSYHYLARSPLYVLPTPYGLKGNPGFNNGPIQDIIKLAHM